MIFQSTGLLNDSIDYPQGLFSPSCPQTNLLSLDTSRRLIFLFRCHHGVQLLGCYQRG